MAAENEVPPGDIVVCITNPAVSAISADGEVVDAGRCADLNAELDGAQLRPLFGDGQAKLRQYAAEARGRHGPGIPDLSRFYIVEPKPDDEETRRNPDALAERLRANELILTAYFKPPHELPQHIPPEPAGAEATRAAPPQLHTPDFTKNQGYLGPASEGGIDAHCAWAGPGGRGEGVQIIDVESAWRFSHEDLLENQGGVLNTAPDDLVARNHGTAVAGILSADDNGFGVTGICPGATIRGISVHGEPGGSAAAIRRAADRLNPGDIILIEQHTYGPISRDRRVEAEAAGPRFGYIPIDIWAEDFAAIRYATTRGVIVVAAAGNGTRNLDDIDDLLKESAVGGFANPFDRKEADSGAIFVGAGAAPLGTLPARSRLAFSNWGSCVDAQGWGERVATTGGLGANEGDLQGGPYEDRWYSNSFGGTSSATPMVAGALACVQGVLMAEGLPPLTPRQARLLLRQSGSPQVPEPLPQGEAETDARRDLNRIGALPNLQELIPRALMMSGGADFVGGGGPMPYGGMNVSIVIGGCGGMQDADYWGGSEWTGPHWRGPHWRGPHWRGPHWRGPHWRGPHWRGPHWRGPSWWDPDPYTPVDLRESFSSPETVDGGRREVRRPGFET